MFWGYLGVGSACSCRGVSTGVTPSRESVGAVGCCGRKWWGAPDTGDGHFLPRSATTALEVFAWEFQAAQGVFERKRCSFGVLNVRCFWELPLLFDVSPRWGGEGEGTRAFRGHLLSWVVLTSWVVCSPSEILASDGFVRTNAIML